MEIAMDVTISDWGKEALGDVPYGIKAVRYVMDTIAAAGINRVHWRSYATGPLYPSRVENAGEYVGELDAYAYQVYGENHEKHYEWIVQSEKGEWDPLAEAVKQAHSKGMKIIAWHDHTENHGGVHQSKWSKLHPECWLRQRDGSHGYPDRHLSFVHPEVVDHYLSLIREMVEDYGVDGVHLVINQDKVGYADHVMEYFWRIYGANPRQLPEDDPRWLTHRAGYVTSYLRKVKGLISDLEEKLCRKIEINVEGQGTLFELLPEIDEPGWPGLDSWACANELVDAERMADEGLADVLTYWRFSELEAMREKLKDRIKLATRYRVHDEARTEGMFRERLEGAIERGCDLFIINESTPVHIYNEWGFLTEILTELGDRVS